MLIALLGCVTRSNHAMDIDGVRRTYQLQVPKSYTPSQPMPLVLALHPFSGTGKSMAWMTGFDRLAEEKGFIAVFPDGQMRRWRATSGDKDVRFLRQLLDTLETEYAVDLNRVYVTGASNGAHMAYRMLCEDSARFAGAAVVMGAQMLRRFDGCPGVGPVPLLMIHGTDDKVLPWGGRQWPHNQPLLSMDESITLWLKRNKCEAKGDTAAVADGAKDSTATTCTRYQGEAPLVVYRVEGGGHTWPGGVDNFPEWVVGKTSRDFDATAVIWDFWQTAD
jgi:polyhydroxybutyrate depolymerase